MGISLFNHCYLPLLSKSFHLATDGNEQCAEHHMHMLLLAKHLSSKIGYVIGGKPEVNVIA